MAFTNVVTHAEKADDLHHERGRDLGGHRYLEQHNPLSSLSPLSETTPGPRKPNESHTTGVGSRK
jgi:hypothetical protein